MIAKYKDDLHRNWYHKVTDAEVQPCKVAFDDTGEPWFVYCYTREPGRWMVLEESEFRSRFAKRG